MITFNAKLWVTDGADRQFPNVNLYHNQHIISELMNIDVWLKIDEYLIPIW